ncbi:Polyketide synthase Pks12 required for biosynthesis of mannosyl-beta-1-phosphomycoketide (MPM) [Mycobacterium tuberculosis CAS/NITR204]|uniref:Polyketide synthase Pks12 required for biosynthesis of mannosyl-beta-1-phosphomycoketide (MPM) n=1 Tax=Mycobacterium tuberculosis CAS/NITR204 TaxID=1310114 RepID=R4M770_MYCTX|nr:Polyketide synthase Pks12 required for biosynthesis of mannosyl-beta-1-phosphomycoketide (MPM) [Mycobacterium tuberculosis CAS/NITR204]
MRSHQALAAVQTWLTDQIRVLVVATRGAMALPREDVADLAGAAVWGLVRSAQTEHPGRIVLVDSDAATDDAAIAMALATGEPQVVLRGGQVNTARVRRAGVMPSWCRRAMGHGGWVWAARAPSKICGSSRFPTPTHRWGPARSGWPCAPSPRTSATS